MYSDRYNFEGHCYLLNPGCPVDRQKTVKKRRAKRELSPEEKAAFHARMVADRKAKEKARQEAAKAEAKKK